MIQPQDHLIDRRRNWEARVEMNVLEFPKEELSTYDKLVYVALCGYANREGSAFPTVERLACNASCSERQVFRALAVLEERGLVVRTPRILPGKGQVGTLYEIHGFEDYIPAATADRPDCQSEGADMTDSQGRTDSQSPPYIRSIEQLQKNSKDYSPSGSGEEPPAGNPEDETAAENLPVTEAPEAMRSTAEYLLLKTGRTGLRESEIADLRKLNAAHYPAVVQEIINQAVDRFRRNGRDLRKLDFAYIADALRHRKPTRPPGGRKAQSGGSVPARADYSDLNV